ncbi:pyridoxal-phosphate dependent enzyme [Actinoplanes teichomyceticus]|uniref:D-cysteine desulfhydrase n=1 Tax=Actinoplanes teichomyceticus TaxID=1867 RepID=A0A561VIE8_ACTTI|nr:pyridoxal-phosphate dependent enzyme [Actinoplanes teichomyceticus]TWG11357.1 D-cysteine desulfhydrase [Actinoplanes teichomyceticus]GIF15828.1 D-cysteine desulfhydrase [Actinoplanes teichomyceticus]
MPGPTPLHRFDWAAGPAYVKRDDTCSPAFGGCKARSLELTLGAALAEAATLVLTAGTVGSNHVAATAVHAHRHGLRVKAFVLPQAPGALVSRNVRLALGAGAQLALTPRGMSLRPTGELFTTELERLRRAGERPYVIPFGGADPRSATAHAYAAAELAAQVRAAGLRTPLHVYLPAASMLTAAGVAAGLALTATPARVVAVDVVGDRRIAGDGLLARARETVARLGGDAAAVRPDGVEVRDAWAERSFGTYAAPGSTVVPLLGGDRIEVEEVYGAKAFAHFRRDATDPGRAPGTWVFWHTADTRPLTPRQPVGHPPADLLPYLTPGGATEHVRGAD